jgi:Glycosyl transferases group 1
MKIAIVSAIGNGIGLQREYELLRDFLSLELGHHVNGIDYEATHEGWMDGAFDLAIFLEVVPRNLLGLSERRWAFLNPEWTKPEMVEIVERSFEKIFAKTHEAERIFEELFPGRVHYTGFLCRDQYDPNVWRMPLFLHLAGNSILRGTEAVLDAWRWKKNGELIDAGLIVVGTAKFDRSILAMTKRKGVFDVERVRFYDRVDEAKLKRLQNMCQYHLLPSATEGFGHALHEALSVGAVVITTGAPPMEEIQNAVLIPSMKEGKFNLATINSVSALDVYHMVKFVTQDDYEINRARLNRSNFLADNAFFKKEMEKHLGSSVKKIERVKRTDGKKTVAFLGNFEAHESTESMVKWALTQRLNIHVEMLQENKVNLAAIREAMEWNDLFLWVRTPGWLQVQEQEMWDFLDELRKKYKKPSVSLHLDKFWGIPAREERIGKDAFWRTDHVWTADGSRQDDFLYRGVKHHWMRPAVSEEYCHPGRPYDHLKCDVLFVGAKDYHEEYPFRRQLVEFLETTYGDRFKHVTNVRGHELNNVYASAKVAVGDCIFAGTPNYWSDRVPETCGRYGLLLHPKVEGLKVYVPTYKPQDLQSLHEEIEKLLELPDSRRVYMRYRAAGHVRHNDTWTIRMKEILGGLL